MRGYVSITYVRLLFEFLEQRGLDAGELLGEAAPPTSELGVSRVPVQRWADLLARADTAIREPALGLKLGALIGPQHFGLLGYLTLCCANLGAALERLRDFERLVYDVNTCTLSQQQDSLTLEWGDEMGRPGQLVDECAVAALIAYTRNITGLDQAAPVEVRFINPAPASIDPYEAFFGCKVGFAAATTLVRLPTRLLSSRLRQPDPALCELLDAQARERIARLPPRDAFEAQLRETIASGLREGGYSLPDCARRLNLSVRTVQRRLEQNQTSFQQALDRARQQLAEAYLRDPRPKLAEVAQLLGYTDQAAFTRAFSRWAGMTPGQWRAQAARQA